MFHPISFSNGRLSHADFQICRPGNLRMAQNSALTLIHADPHRGNLFLPVNTSQHTPVWIDWQTYVRGLAPYDLAYWLWTSQSTEVRRHLEKPLLHWYYERLLAGGIQKYSWDDCVYDYRLCMVINLFSGLRWMNYPIVERGMIAFEDWDGPALIGR